MKLDSKIIQVEEEMVPGSAEAKSKKRDKKQSSRPRSTPPTSSITSPIIVSSSRSSEADTINTTTSNDPLEAFFTARNYANPITFQHFSEVGFTVHELRSMQGLNSDVITERFRVILGGQFTAVIESLAFIISTSSPAAWTKFAQ